jgi:hypothetical protein
LISIAITILHGIGSGVLALGLFVLSMAIAACCALYG